MLGARACLSVHSLGEKDGEEEGGGVGMEGQCSEITTQKGLLFVSIFQWRFKSI